MFGVVKQMTSAWSAFCDALGVKMDVNPRQGGYTVRYDTIDERWMAVQRVMPTGTLLRMPGSSQKATAKRRYLPRLCLILSRRGRGARPLCYSRVCSITKQIIYRVRLLWSLERSSIGEGTPDASVLPSASSMTFQDKSLQKAISSIEV
jgi:hypothetical protein